MEGRAWMKTGMILGLFLVAGVSGCGDDGGGPDDTRAPAAVTDLVAGSPTSSSITLTWTATGDDSLTGKAASYDIRYSTGALSEATFSSATAVSGVPAPKVAGSTESLLLTGLQSLTRYQFALKVRDEAGNLSGLSNIVVDTTAVEADQCPPGLSGRIALSIVYPAVSGHDGEIVVFDINTAELMWVTDNSTIEFCPRWSPDGSSLAFNRDGDGGKLVIAAEDGSGEVVAAGEDYDAWDHWWSPDGGWILNLSGNWQEGPGQLVRIRPNGIEVDTVVHDAACCLSYNGSPWSPTGDEMAYETYTDHQADLHIMNVVSGVSRLLVADGGDPVWLRDDHIFFTRSGEENVWKIQADGSGAERCAEVYDWLVSPDFQRIASRGRLPEAGGRLQMVEVSSCVSEQVEEYPGGLELLAWSPDSRFLLLGVYGHGDRDSLGVYDRVTGITTALTCLTAQLPGDSLIFGEYADWAE